MDKIKEVVLKNKKLTIGIALVIVIAIIAIVVVANKKAEEKELNEMVQNLTDEVTDVVEEYKLKDTSVNIDYTSLDTSTWELTLESSNFDKLSYEDMAALNYEMPLNDNGWNYVVGKDTYTIDGDKETYTIYKNGKKIHECKPEEEEEEEDEEETPKVDSKDVQKATCDDGSYTYSRPLSYNEKLRIAKDFIALQNAAEDREDIDYISDEELEQIYEDEVYSVIRAKYNVTDEDIQIIFVDEDGEILEEAYKY